MTNVRGPSVPLVVRVKRAADEEPLDIIRLCPPHSKLARGTVGTFSLHDLQFKHAGTIVGKDELPERTAELIDSRKTTSVNSTTITPEVVDGVEELPSVSETETLEKIVEKPLGTLKRNQRMYMIAKTFRPVSTTQLDDILDPWTRFFADERDVEGVGKRKHEEETSVPRKNFVLCDLESYVDPPQSKKSRTNEVLTQYGSGITCNEEEMVAEIKKQPDFVYDVYTFNPSTEDVYTDVYNSMSNLDFILGTNSENDFFNEVEIENEKNLAPPTDEDDSNDEDNWRNEYPDDESDDSDEEKSGSGNASSEEDNFDSYGNDTFGLDHSYVSHAHRSRKTVDSDASSEASDKDDEDD